MTDTLQAIAKSLSDDVRVLSSISHNVANMHTPGYRAVRAIPEFDPDVSDRDAALTAVIDQRDGALAQTGNEMDVALRGPGFFVVERDGKQLLSRSGSFRGDHEGKLINSVGDALLGYAGILQLPEGKVRFEHDGQIYVSDRAIGQLQIVGVADASKLRPAGDGAFAYEGEIVEWNGRLVQGAIEQANVDAAEETVRLMEVTRHAESVQRAISIYDKAMDTGINQIGGN